jgi:hypothetical protein
MGFNGYTEDGIQVHIVSQASKATQANKATQAMCLYLSRTLGALAIHY